MLDTIKEQLKVRPVFVIADEKFPDLMKKGNINGSIVEQEEAASKVQSANPGQLFYTNVNFDSRGVNTCAKTRELGICVIIQR